MQVYYQHYHARVRYIYHIEDFELVINFIIPISKLRLSERDFITFSTTVSIYAKGCQRRGRLSSGQSHAGWVDSSSIYGLTLLTADWNSNRFIKHSDGYLPAELHFSTYLRMVTDHDYFHDDKYFYGRSTTESISFIGWRNDISRVLMEWGIKKTAKPTSWRLNAGIALRRCPSFRFLNIITHYFAYIQLPAASVG